ncbi:MAG: hypothetical protein ACYDDO_13045 [Acidiferrobacterales bacterium]
MKENPASMQWAIGFTLMAGVISLAHAGPPLMTDDPEPLNYKHSEAYVFSTYDKGPDRGKAIAVPAFVFNTVPMPDVHLHVAVPFLDLRQNDGVHIFGLGDVELGVKYRFVHETDSRPQIDIFRCSRFRRVTGMPGSATAGYGKHCPRSFREAGASGRPTVVAVERSTPPQA